MTEIRQKMEHWAKLRCSSSRLGYGPTFLEKCLEGMPGTHCPLCSGRGKTRSYPVCPTCSGSGRIKLDPALTRDKVNPAFIPSTHLTPDDPVSEKIDRLICTLRKTPKTQALYFVLMQEYTRNGTQEIKAGRIHISHAYYRKLLQRGHAWMEMGLRSPFCHNSNNKALQIA